MFHERLHDGLVEARAVLVEVHQSVESKAVFGGDGRQDGNVGLQGAAGADTHDVEGAVFRLHLHCLEVDIGESIQLVHHDVNIVGAHAGGEGADAFSAQGAGVGHQFAVLPADFDGVEAAGDVLHTSRVTHHDDMVSNFFGMKAEVVYLPSGLQRKF